MRKIQIFLCSVSGFPSFLRKLLEDVLQLNKGITQESQGFSSTDQLQARRGHGSLRTRGRPLGVIEEHAMPCVGDNIRSWGGTKKAWASTRGPVPDSGKREQRLPHRQLCGSWTHNIQRGKNKCIWNLATLKMVADVGKEAGGLGGGRPHLVDCGFSGLVD